MLKSRNISDYFEAKLSEVRANETLTFDVYLYFPANKHILLFHRKEETPTVEFIHRYRSKGLEKIYVHGSDRDAYLRYTKPPAEQLQAGTTTSATKPTEEIKATQPAEVAPAAPQPKTEEGAFIAAVLDSPKMNEEQKKAVAGEVAKSLIEDAAEAKDYEEQIEINKKLQDTVEDVLDQTANLSESAVADIWKLCKVDADCEHSVNVATYAVIFAMAFGKVDPKLLADLAMAALLHDIGLSQVQPRLASQIWKQMNPNDKQVYAEHVDQSLQIISQLEQIPERVKTLIHQHHEKFDGTGYPLRVSGFKFDDLSQLLSMSDFLDAMSSGTWDGNRRTVKEAFTLLDSIEKARSFPEYFNPDLFAVVMKWLKSGASQNVAESAAKLVGEQAKNVVDGKSAA